jgi:hypothetical protein
VKPMSDHAARLEARLAALERRRRWLALLWAKAAWLAVVLPAAALFCFVDWYSHMPLVARWAALAALVALGWFGLRRWVLPALGERRSVDQNALAVDGRFPELADGIISAIQLDRRAGEFGYGSPEMTAAAQAQAAERAARLDFGRAAPLAPRLPVLLAGLAAVAGALWGVGSQPRIVGIWAARCFWTFEYPCKTRIESCPDRLVVARGDPAEIVVRAGGLLPAGGRIWLRSEAKGSAEVERELPRAGRGGKYLARIEEVVEPLRFRVRLGDAPEVEGRIVAVSRPEVAAVSVRLEYPAYTGLASETVKTGHLRAVPGTRAAVTIEPSKPLASARLVFGDGREQPMELTAGGSSAGARFAVEKSGEYAVHLADQEGFGNTAPVRYQISAVPDALPRVMLVKPGAEALATPVSAVRIEYKISDDYGLRAGRLAFRLNEEKAWKTIPLPFPGVDPKNLVADLARPGPRRADQAFLWDLSTLGYKIGDVITYRLEAFDHCDRGPAGAAGASPDREIRIVSEEVIAKRLQEDLENAAKVVEGVLRLERDSQDRIRKLLEEIRKGQGK